MMRFIPVLLTAAWFMLAATAHAHAEPITVALFGAAFAASISGAVVTAVISSAVAYAASWAIGLLTKAEEAGQAPQGFQLDAQIGDAVPLSFPVGLSATAGTRKYIGSWGNDGETPNAYLTDVYQISDLVGSGLAGFWANKVKRTLLAGEANELGAPVLEFRVAGKDHMWVRYHSGRETTADALLLAKFGTHSTRPWTSEMVGVGCEYVVVTMLVNRELFTAQPVFLFEQAPRPWYDLRKDSTNGGVGSHRWGDQSTWEPSQNVAVIIYNLIRGVTYGDEWIYGGQNLPAFRLPPSSWMAAANECDVAIPMAGGGSEPQFRCGTEVRGNVEPLAQIQELLVACNGRLAEVGGIFELLVGAPGAAVFSFTDDDIYITRGQSLAPFPTLQQTHNGIEATYPEPLEMWAPKDAPARYSAELEAEDGERRLISGINYGSVPFGTQAQRLMDAGVKEDRRFRTHALSLGPETWAYTPNCVYSWTSARNGYTNKKFLVVAKEGEAGMLQPTALKEVDPSDYGWSSSNELPSSTGSIGTVTPPPQEVSGFYVLPAVIDDGQGRGRRPAIDAFWSEASVTADVRAVRITVRLEKSGDVVWEGEAPRPKEGRARIGQNLLNLQDYEVQIQYVPYSGRVTIASAWLAVTTPDIRMSVYDINDDFKKLTGILPGIGSLDERFKALELQLGKNALAGMSIATSLRKDTDNARASFAQQVTIIVDDMQALADETTLLRADFNDNRAFVGTQLTALSTADGALAQLINQVEIEVDGVSASGLFKMEARAAPAGITVRLAFMARKSVGDGFVETGILIDIFPDNSTRIAWKANSVVLIDEINGAVTAPFTYGNGQFYMSNVVIDGAYIKALSVDTLSIAHGAVTGLWAVISESQITITSNTEGIIQQIYIPAQGDTIVVSCFAHTESQGSGISRCTLQMRKNGVVVASNPIATDDEPTTFNGLNYIEVNPNGALYDFYVVADSGGTRFRRRFFQGHNGFR